MNVRRCNDHAIVGDFGSLAVLDHIIKDAVGSVPVGMNLGGEPLNYWHVADAQAADMPGRLALGHHGKALWFANPNRGTTQDPSGGTPQGSILLAPMDLRQIMQPTLSFSSYYETRTGPRDLKTVEIRTQDASGAWSLFQTIKTIGYDGTGYGAWRSQSVSLDAYANSISQVRFVYNSVTPPQEGYMGWLIDDISLGHDHDLDELPDALENKRQDILIANQVIPVHIQPSSTGTSYVRRLVRPYADSFQFEALVSNPNPAALTVTVGVAANSQDTEHNYVLWSSGTDHSGCTTTRSNGVETGSRAAVINRGDGLDINLDLQKCSALASSIPQTLFSEARDWFLKVQAPSSGATWIESLKVVTSGKTNYAAFDTNHDDVSDGDKVDKLHDPLGYDADQDGIPNQVDPDDTVPSWAPALKVSSTDYSTFMDIELQDNLAQVPGDGVTVEGQDNSTGQINDLSLNYTGGTTWRINPGQYGSLPDVLIVKWQDVYGTAGTMKLYMTTTSGSYGPAGLDWSARDASTQKSASFTQTFVQQAGPTIILCATSTAATGAGEALCAGLSLFALGYTAYLVLNAATVAVEDAQHHRTEYSPPPALPPGQQRLCRIDQVCLNLVSTTVGALSAVELAAAWENAQYHLPGPGGTERWVWDDGTTLWFITVGLSQSLEKLAENSWKIRLPSIADDTASAIEHMIQMERARLLALALQLGIAVEVAYEYAYCMRFCTPPKTPDTAKLHSWGQGMPLRLLEETWIMPPGVVLALHQRYNDLKSGDKNSTLLTATEATLGELSFQRMRYSLAPDDRFESHLRWYWYDDNFVPNCNGNPPIRRCANYQVQNSTVGLEFWANVGSSSDKLATRPVDWTSGHHDTLATKGLVKTEQLIGLEAGQDPWLGVLHKMYESSARGHADKNADAAVSYDFLVDKSLEVTVDYRST